MVPSDPLRMQRRHPCHPLAERALGAVSTAVSSSERNETKEEESANGPRYIKI
jgi:hypothetical protein